MDLLEKFLSKDEEIKNTPILLDNMNLEGFKPGVIYWTGISQIGKSNFPRLTLGDIVNIVGKEMEGDNNE